MRFYSGIGQDSHRFLPPDVEKSCIIGGIVFEGIPGLDADSDGDVILHAICNAISSITHVPILGKIAPKLCFEEHIRDSSVYLQHAMDTLKEIKIHHVAITVEGKRPRMQSRVDQIRFHIAKLMDLDVSQVGLTVTSGDGLSDFGRGDGLQCFCIVTAVKM
ncbi:MAG: 2-C-methyl-D-erythritol 2,4-cyclodiphosphate synthase [Chlamydiales bacterium]|nr:2-C-methyl-D-erythritol 2,4-cyclodiphosphate synthase [Chlamydiales bacterium]